MNEYGITMPANTPPGVALRRQKQKEKKEWKRPKE